MLPTVRNFIFHLLLILRCPGNTGDVIDSFVCNSRKVMAEHELKVFVPAEERGENTGKSIKL